MSDFCYVYILETEEEPRRYYIGFTENLHEWLKSHNAGHVPHTAKYSPWRINTAVAFRDRARGFAFEQYLKSGASRAFSRKHL